MQMAPTALINPITIRMPGHPKPGRTTKGHHMPAPAEVMHSGHTPWFQPGDPCRELLTEEEAVRYLRLDLVDIKRPRETLRRYRKLGHLRATQVSKRVFYLRKNLDAFLDASTDINPR